MAEVSVTAAEVLVGAGAVVKTGTAGATITAGDVLYEDPVTGKLLLAQRDATATEAQVVGIALGGGGDGQKIEYQTGGTIEIGSSASIAEAAVYILGTTAGAMQPHTDHDPDGTKVPAATQYTTLIGIGNDDNGLELCIKPSVHQISA